MRLIKHKVYDPSYRGWASEGTIEFHTLRSDFIENIASWIATVGVETVVRANNGELIETKIYGEDSSWGGINTFRMKVVWRFYPKALALGQAVPVAWPAIVLGAVLFIIGIIAIAFLLQTVKDVFIAIEPYLPWILVAIIGIPVLTFLALLLTQKKEKT